MAAVAQLGFAFVVPAPPCEHRYHWLTLATVPAGRICSDCGSYYAQQLPQSPEKLGYLSGEWAWGQRNGFRWTTRHA